MMQLNSNGTGSTTFNSIGTGFSGSVFASAIQGDGKIIVGGSFSFYFDGTFHEVGNIARLNTDGTLDTTFNQDAVSSLWGVGFNGLVSSIAIQSDGKILVGGSFDRYADKYSDFLGHSGLGNIARLNTDGTLDLFFKPLGAGFNDPVSAIAVLGSGKILVGGSFTSYSDGPPSSVGHIAKLNIDGTLDTSFKSLGAGFDYAVSAIAVQSSGKILVGGSFTSYSDGTSYDVGHIARLDADGALDTTFTNGVGKGFNDDVYTIALQDSGNILVGGSFTSYSDGSSSSVRHIARLNKDTGALDITFSLGTGFNDDVRTLALQYIDDEYILVGGEFTSYNDGSVHDIGKIARLNTDGTLDSTFSPGAGFNDRVFTVIVQISGKVLAGGDFVSYDDSSIYQSAGFIAKLGRTYGVFDTTFNTGTGFDYDVYTLAAQSDGKILAGGHFTSYNDGSDHTNLGYIARLNTDGTFDTTFAPAGSVGFDGTTLSIAVQGDGGILVGGAFSSYNGDPVGRIARLNKADGTLDSTFVHGVGFDGYVFAVAVQEDGKILVGGDFNTYNGDAVGHDIARLNADGTLDTSFTSASGTGFDYTVYIFLVQSDGKILVGGDFGTYNGDAVGHMARLNANGTRDTTFNPSGEGLNNTPYGFSIQSNGKILVGGSFSTYNGDPVGYIVSLNSDGTKDTLFNMSGTGFDFGISALAIQNDGKILVGGSFNSYNDSSDHRAGYIVRLNTDGTFDTTFSLNKGFDGQVYGIAIK